MSAKDRLYYLRNRHWILQQNADYARQHRDRKRLYDIAYRQQNAARIRAYLKAWRKANRPRVNNLQVAYRARVRGSAGGKHTAQEWREKCELFAYCCAYCGERKPLERDHNIPVSRGGTDSIENIIPACRSCNAAKHNLFTAQEYIAYRMSRKALA